MKKFLMILPMLTLGLAACQTEGQNAAVGGLAGAAVGAAVSDNETQGALIGAAVGVAASTLVRPANAQGQCTYRNTRTGQTYLAACP
jgi:Glycine zipper 2TM domain